MHSFALPVADSSRRNLLVDAWRKKMSDHNNSLGPEVVSTVPPYLETRAGKKAWVRRRERSDDGRRS